jgi:hypothetical protein
MRAAPPRKVRAKQLTARRRLNTGCASRRHWIKSSAPHGDALAGPWTEASVRQIQYARRHFSRDAFRRSFLEAIGDQEPAASP